MTKCIQSLTAAGLLVPESDGSVTYAPASADLRQTLEEVEALYTKQPDAVRRLIVASQTGFSLTDFANAFRWRDR